jgi:hypothetical protein
MTVTMENRSIRNTTCPIITLCAIKPTWVDLGLSLSLLQSVPYFPLSAHIISVALRVCKSQQRRSSTKSHQTGNI